MSDIEQTDRSINTTQMMTSYSAAIGLLSSILRDNPQSTIDEIQGAFREEYNRIRAALKLLRQEGYSLPATEGDQIDLLRALSISRGDAKQIIEVITAVAKRISIDGEGDGDVPEASTAPGVLIAIAKVQQVIGDMPMNQDSGMATEYLANSVCEVAKAIGKDFWKHYIRYAGDLVVEAYISTVIFKANLHGEMASRRTIERMLEGFKNLTTIVDLGRSAEVAEMNRTLPDFILETSAQIVNGYQQASQQQRAAMQYPVCEYMANRAVKIWQKVSTDISEDYQSVMDDPVELRKWFMQNTGANGGVDVKALVENELLDVSGFGSQVDIDLQAVERYAMERAKLTLAAQAAISDDF